MIWGVTEMWVVLIASGVAPLWPLLKRLGLTIATKLERSGLRSSQKYTNDSDSSKPHARKNDTARLPDFHRPFNRSASQEAMVPTGGIEMKQDFMVSHDVVSLSDVHGDRQLGSTQCGTGYGRSPWEDNRL